MSKVLIDACKCIVITENHGGYLGGECIWCGAVGWVDRLKHEPDCPVPAAMLPENNTTPAFYQEFKITQKDIDNVRETD